MWAYNSKSKVKENSTKIYDFLISNLNFDCTVFIIFFNYRTVIVS